MLSVLGDILHQSWVNKKGFRNRMCPVIRVDVCLCVHTYIHAYIHPFIHTYTHIHTYVVHTNTYKATHTHTYIYIYVCWFVCVCLLISINALDILVGFYLTLAYPTARSTQTEVQHIHYLRYVFFVPQRVGLSSKNFVDARMREPKHHSFRSGSNTCGLNKSVPIYDRINTDPFIISNH